MLHIGISLAQALVGILQARVHCIECRYNAFKLIFPFGRVALQPQRALGAIQLIAADKVSNRRKMPGHETGEDIDDKQRNEKCFRCLPDQDEQHRVHELAIQIGKCCFDVENADLPINAVNLVDDREFARNRRTGCALPDGDHQGRIAIDRFSHFNGAYV